MARLGATVAALSGLRKRWREAATLGIETLGGAEPSNRLKAVSSFGSNPGELAMFTFVPEGLPAGRPLVVVLHGCGQSADGYDVGTGWSALAEEQGFALLYPQQSAGNNQNRCFNWFVPGDTRRDEGEALSIRQMVDRCVADHGLDPARIFVTGLSAGGAMAAVMLATYPEVFAAGGIVAGLPYGAAGSVQQAFQAMANAPARDGRAWGDLARAASRETGSWPRASIWHGSADAVVGPSNAAALVRQWTDLHGVDATKARRDVVGGQAHEVWHDASGRAVVESFTIAGMGHGTPLHVGDGPGMGGNAGPYLLDVGISSTHHLATFWGLIPDVTTRSDPAVVTVTPAGTVVWPSVGREQTRPAAPPRETRRSTGPLDVGAIIGNALKAAGLTKR